MKAGGVLVKRFYTVGMAGHIDHGKTSLTKALTNVDTDRLKEEKERQISIEPGFALLYEDDDIQISIVDVPGHERFIRQMIAGVAGIDLVVLAVAADEGVMPQTKEHVEILSFLGINHGIVAMTKAGKADLELLGLARDDIESELEGTVFEHSPIIPVDSLDKTGIDELKAEIMEQLRDIPTRSPHGDFRFPIDQVFSVKGQGTVVRGTVFEGSVTEGEKLYLLPCRKEVRARQIQVHHERKASAAAGQRAAINVAGADREDMSRGDVLVSSSQVPVSGVLDIALKFTENLKSPVKQRMVVKCHIGTKEATGKLVFFDRNEEADGGVEVLCQLRLDDKVPVKRGDRFIIRRPSPAETIGGGWVIDPAGGRYRFGEQTIRMLHAKKTGTPEERLRRLVTERLVLSKEELARLAGITQKELAGIVSAEGWLIFGSGFVTSESMISALLEQIDKKLDEHHEKSPLQAGMKKAELVAHLSVRTPKHLAEFAVSLARERGTAETDGQYMRRPGFRPHVPQEWEKRTESLLSSLQEDGWQTAYFQQYLTKAGIPDHLHEPLTHFLLNDDRIIRLEGDMVWHRDVFMHYARLLKDHLPDGFETKDTKEVLGFSRKYLIPFLEALDGRNITLRNGSSRSWA